LRRAANPTSPTVCSRPCATSSVAIMNRRPRATDLASASDALVLFGVTGASAFAMVTYGTAAQIAAGRRPSV
jgi:hypothetical protein